MIGRADRGGRQPPEYRDDGWAGPTTSSITPGQ